MPDLTVDHGRALALDLLHELSPDVGDPDAINDTLGRWCDLLGPQRFGLVSMAALQAVFLDCLTVVPLDAVPAGSTTYQAPEEAA